MRSVPPVHMPRGRVVIESEQGGALGVVILAKSSVADDRQRMGDACGLHAVLA